MKPVSVDANRTATPLNRAIPLPTGSRRRPLEGGATFPLSNRIRRAVWNATWRCLASWTPSFCMGWRRFLLRAFGASLADTSEVYGSARVWFPPNLRMGEYAQLADGVNCYNVAPVTLEDWANVSQGAYLCAASHDVDDPDFPLISAPITLGSKVWIAADAFVGPGVTVGEGAVLGARSVAVRDLAPWTVYAGNPAQPRRQRKRRTGGK